MRIFLALIIAPSLALAAQTGMYSLVTPSCTVQTRLGVHLVALACLVLAGVFTLLARGEWSRLGLARPPGPDSDFAEPAAVRRFLAAVATAVGALSCLVIVAMWFAGWVLSPCS